MQKANPLPNVAGLCKGFLLSCKAGTCFTCKAQSWEQGSLFSRWNGKGVQLMGIRKGQTVWQRGFLKRYQAAVAGAEHEMLSQTARCMCARQVPTKTHHAELQ